MNLRDKIILATEQVVLKNGLARTTTKEIAQAAGCSERSIYNHFENKDELFIQVIKVQLTKLMEVMTSLPDRTGIGSVRENLKEVSIVALQDYYNSMPLLASIFSDPGLLLRHREGFIHRKEGPHRANETVSEYIHKEQLLGRINNQIDPRAAADMLLGSCFQKAFQMKFQDQRITNNATVEFADHILDIIFQ